MLNSQLPNIGCIIDRPINSSNIVNNIDPLRGSIKHESNPCRIVTLIGLLFSELQTEEWDEIKEGLFSTLDCLVKDDDSMFNEDHLAEIHHRCCMTDGKHG